MAPRCTVTQVSLAKGDSVPYRTRRKVENDVTPIHRQCFPLGHPLRARANLILEVTNETTDVVPIHREVFPTLLSHGGQDDQAWDELDPMSDPTLRVLNQEHHSETPASIPATLHIARPHQVRFSQTRQPVPPPSPQPVSPVVHIPATVSPNSQVLAKQAQGHSDLPSFVTDQDALNTSDTSRVQPAIPVLQRRSSRKERKIRGLEEWMGWYESVGGMDLKQPPHCEDAEFGDLFVHMYGTNHVQVWIRASSKKWDVATSGQKHPYLPGYRLLVKNGKPSWLTRKTIATYSYRDNSAAS